MCEMNNYIKAACIAGLLAGNGVLGALVSQSIRDGNIPWYLTYVISLISASIYAYQLRAKVMPLTVMSVFQTFFFHSAWYTTAFFILGNELKGHKIIGLMLAFAGMITMSIWKDNMNLTQTQLEAAVNIACEKCGCEVMKNVFVVKSISALLMHDGKEALIPVPVFACNDCSHINNKFSAELKIAKKE